MADKVGGTDKKVQPKEQPEKNQANQGKDEKDSKK